MFRSSRGILRRWHRPAAFAIVATLVLAACGGSSASPAFTGPLLSDPDQIVARSLSALNDARTFHLDGQLTGTLNADLTGSGTTSAIDLKGTSLAADADVPNQRATLSIKVPALFALTVDYIQIGPDTYSRNSLDGSTWTHTSQADTSASGSSLAPGSSASPAASIGPAPSLDLVGQLTAALDSLPNPPTKGADVPCGSKTCYSVSIEAPLSSGGTDPLGLPLPSAATANVSIQLDIERDTFRPVQAMVVIDAGTSGTFTLALTLSKFDEPVTISPPPSDQVVEASPGA
jgi:hypothetical protein